MSTFLDYVGFFIMLVCTGIVFGYILDKLVNVVLKRKLKKEPAGGKELAFPASSAEALTSLLSATNLTVVAMSLYNYPIAKSLYVVLQQGDQRIYCLKLTNPSMSSYELGMDLFGLKLSSVTVRNYMGTPIINLMYEEFDDISAELCWWKLTATLVDITVP